MTNIISFDVGIKNMAYCIFDVTVQQPLKIMDWKIINLMNEEDICVKLIHKCNCMIIKNKNKKVKEPGVCGKNAKYVKYVKYATNEQIKYYCEKHAQVNETYLLPKKELEPTSLKKMKMEDLLKLCYSHSLMNIPNDQTNTPLYELKKPELVNIAITFFKEKSLEWIVYKKQKTANETDIISIGRNMKRELDKIDISTISNVLIENQISTIAPRMNSIQGMLVQYFIMVSSAINIQFISSSNKLKGFPTPPTRQFATALTTSKDTIYKEHKKDGIYHCMQFLENNGELKKWKYVLDTPKKDDYADCFLQGIFYFRKSGNSSVFNNTNIYVL